MVTQPDVVDKGVGAGGDKPKDVVKQPRPEKMCPYCTGPDKFKYVSTRAGAMSFARHVTKVHPDQTELVKKAKDTEEKIEGLSPLATRLYEVATRILRDKPALVETLCELFERNANVLGTNRHMFRSWIMRYGLATDQIAQIEDHMFGVDLGGAGGFGPPGGSAGQQYLVPDGRGGYAQVVVVPTGGGQGYAGDLRDIRLTLAQPPGGAQGQDPETKREIETLTGLVADLSQKIEKLAEAPKGPVMVRRPVFDGEGHARTDASGAALYEEVPYDPNMNMLQMFQLAIQVARPKEQALTAEDVERILERREGRSRDGEMPKEWRDILDGQKAQIAEMNTKLAGMQRESEIKTAIDQAVKPLQDEIKGLQGRTGLSENQFLLTHRERLQQTWQGFVGGMLEGIREDMRPVMMNQAIGSMRAQGVPDEIIQQVVASVGGVARRAIGIQSKIDEARTKWLK